jgi:hypothetical protein
MEGYNGTIMAYGQTGAGKTHTLSSISEHNIGVIPRAVAEIFHRASADPMSSYTVQLSYVQLYCEMLQDLLNPEAQNLQIREGDRSGVFLTGATELPVTCLEDALGLLELGEKHRTSAFTHLNSHSSRSHAIAILTVVKARNPKFLTNAEKAELRRLEKEGGPTFMQKAKIGRLFLVDLAGSERLKKSRSVGVRQSEAISINKSLTALGMCINARAEEKNHVPFRDSKLTRLLQESLGGNARTTLIVCVADALEHVDETLQSLQFGSRAMSVKTQAVVNEIIDYKQQYSRILEQLDEVEDTQHLIEVSLLQAEEERDAIRAEKEAEAKKFQGILEQLQRETLGEIASITSLMEIKEREAKEAIDAAQAAEAKVAADKGQEIMLLSRALEAKDKDVSLLQTELEASQMASVTLKQELERVLIELARTKEDLSDSQGQCASLKSEADILKVQNLCLAQDLSQAKTGLQRMRLAWLGVESESKALLITLTADDVGGSKEVSSQDPSAPAPLDTHEIEDAVARMLNADGDDQQGAAPEGEGEVIRPHLNPAFEFSQGPDEPSEEEQRQLSNLTSFRSMGGSMARLQDPPEGPSAQDEEQEGGLVMGVGALNVDLDKLAHSVALSMAEVQRVAKDCRGQVVSLEGDKFESTRQAEETARRVSELSLTIAGLEAEVERHKGVAFELRQEADKVHQTRIDIFTERVDIGKKIRSALAVQKAWRRWKARALTARASDAVEEVNLRLQSIVEVSAANERRRQEEAETEADLHRARVGRAMVISSLDLARDAVEAISIAFLGRKRELENRARLKSRLEGAAPILSHGRSYGLSTALSLLIPQASMKEDGPRTK